MFCEKCGKKLNDNATFCRYCGTKIKLDNKDNANNNTNVGESAVNESGSKLERERKVQIALIIGIGVVILIAIIIVVVLMTGSKSKDTASSDSSYSSTNNGTANSYNSNSSNVTTNKSTNSSAYNRNSTSSQQDLKKAIVGKWQISSFAYPDEFSTRDGKIINYIGSNPNSKYQYMVMYAMLDFREDGRIYSFSGFDIFKYEIRDNDTVVAVDIANNGNGLGGAVVTFKYDWNNKTLTVENFTNNEGKVITDNGAGSGYDRSKAIGNVYRKLN